MELKYVRCYKYHKDGHIAKSYPNRRGAKPANNMISLESSESVAEPAEPEP